MFDVAIVDEACSNPTRNSNALTAAKGRYWLVTPNNCHQSFALGNRNHPKYRQFNLLNHMYIDELFLRFNNVTFNKQYRMINQIGDLINKLFYSGKLINGRNEDAEDWSG